jgi:hypothetical protein
VAAQDPHWIEYIAAVGGLAGVLLAVVAAMYAKRSADAATHAVSLARDEINKGEERRICWPLLRRQRSLRTTTARSISDSTSTGASRE